MEGSFPLRNLINVRTERNWMAAGQDSRVPVVGSVRFDATAFATSILAGNRRPPGCDVDHSSRQTTIMISRHAVSALPFACQSLMHRSA
jgi:hypothetical protein